ncbi:hypothetical protein C8Q80DRAFT_1266740 [Daedaleopsis nitida]|nr:hypothetical protein C8Q80DRAFT_1266740 [Daedaleopsis nitida]
MSSTDASAADCIDAKILTVRRSFLSDRRRPLPSRSLQPPPVAFAVDLRIICAAMSEDIGASHPVHYALLAYARDMHQYTLELWTELSKKVDAANASHTTVPHAETAPAAATAPAEHDERRGAPSGHQPDAESPQDE